MFFIIFHEHSFGSEKYLFKNNKSNKLIVFFSAFGPENSPGVYNYVWSSKTIKADKLWIRDRCGYNKVGTYYLGNNYPDLSFIQEVERLIKKYGSNKEIICCGTSKGAWAALFYGIRLNVSKIIVGSPQYYIGTYLNEKPYHQKTHIWRKW